MPRYKVTIEYDGTNYSGWQKQINSSSICAEIELAIKHFCQEEVEVYGSGRTDAGVHAFGQVAHFNINHNKTPTHRISNALNYYLKGKEIVILNCEEVSEDFHARFSAKERSYLYKIVNRKFPSMIYLNRAMHVYDTLDLEKMQIAASLLIGNHDFSSFRAAHCQGLSPIKTVNEIRLDQSEDIITLYISAKSFLYHMVRNIVGSLCYVGSGKMSIEQFREAFLAKDRRKMGPTAPASGLYFYKVKY